MKISINNKSREISENISLLDLLNEMLVAPEKTLISINENVIPQEEFANTILKENDSIDLFSFVGGG